MNTGLPEQEEDPKTEQEPVWLTLNTECDDSMKRSPWSWKSIQNVDMHFKLPIWVVLWTFFHLIVSIFTSCYSKLSVFPPHLLEKSSPCRESSRSTSINILLKGPSMSVATGKIPPRLAVNEGTHERAHHRIVNGSQHKRALTVR